MDIVRQAEAWEKEMVKTFSEDPNAPIIQQIAYAEDIFNALVSGESDLNEAGYRNWRMKISVPGAIAYNAILKTEIANKTDWKEAVKKAWRGFWNAGKIITVKRDGVVVKSIANGKEQFCQWPLARWKLAHHRSS